MAASHRSRLRDRRQTAQGVHGCACPACDLPAVHIERDCDPVIRSLLRLEAPGRAAEAVQAQAIREFGPHLIPYLGQVGIGHLAIVPIMSGWRIGTGQSSSG